MAEHSAELAYEQPQRFRRAVAYVVSSVACGLAGSYVGVFLGRCYLDAVALRLASSQWLPKAMVVVVVGCVARAFLSLTGSPIFPRGFVSDPTNPEFVGMKEVQVGLRRRLYRPLSLSARLLVPIARLVLLTLCVCSLHIETGRSFLSGSVMPGANNALRPVPFIHS
jgi:hypothetical protein